MRDAGVIRKPIIWVLVLAAVATVFLTVVSFKGPLQWHYGDLGRGRMYGISCRGGTLSALLYKDTTQTGPAATQSIPTSGSRLTPASGLWSCKPVIQGNQAVLEPAIRFLGASLKGYTMYGQITFELDEGAIPFTGAVEVREVTLPLWMLFAVFATYPAVVLVRGPLRRRRRRRMGLCIRCGYNLKGLPEPRCPECGRTVKQP